MRLEPTRQDEIVEELSQHLDDRYAEMLAGGATDEAARRATLAELNDRNILQLEMWRGRQTIAAEPIVLGAGRRNIMADVNSDERVVVEKSSMNVGGIIAAIALLLLVLGVLKFLGISPL